MVADGALGGEMATKFDSEADFLTHVRRIHHVKRMPVDETTRLRDDRWKSLSGEERLTYVFQLNEIVRQSRLERIRRMNPGASDAEVEAIWVEEMYKDDLSPEVLKWAQHAIRTWDESKQSG